MNHKRIKNLIDSLAEKEVCEAGRIVISQILQEFGYEPPAKKENPEYTVQDYEDQTVITLNQRATDFLSAALISINWKDSLEIGTFYGELYFDLTKTMFLQDGKEGQTTIREDDLY